jgi:RimJ/RimL family protein N-acetyltransferase
MDDLNRPPLLRQVKSARMNLIAATTELLKKDIENTELLASALGAVIPESWPPDLYGPTAKRFALQQLGDPTEQSWSFWYLMTQDEPTEMIGICGFKGRPDASGSVEIGYSVLDHFQRQGYATEAVTCLVGWAFSHHNVHEVSAETLPHLSQSIRVLEKNGFQFTGAGSEAGVVRYAVKRSSLI